MQWPIIEIQIIMKLLFNTIYYSNKLLSKERIAQYSLYASDANKYGVSVNVYSSVLTEFLLLD